MRWPWVSRELLDEAVRVRDAQIAKLDAQIEDLHRERKKLLDRIAYGYGGTPIYEPQSRPAYDETRREEANLDKPVPSPVERIIAQTGGKARLVVKKLQEENDRRYAEELKSATISSLDQAIAEGKAVAEKGSA